MYWQSKVSGGQKLGQAERATETMSSRSEEGEFNWESANLTTNDTPDIRKRFWRKCTYTLHREPPSVLSNACGYYTTETLPGESSRSLLSEMLLLQPLPLRQPWPSQLRHTQEGRQQHCREVAQGNTHCKHLCLKEKHGRNITIKNNHFTVITQLLIYCHYNLIIYSMPLKTAIAMPLCVISYTFVRITYLILALYLL